MMQPGQDRPDQPLNCILDVTKESIRVCPKGQGRDGSNPALRVQYPRAKGQMSPVAQTAAAAGATQLSTTL